MLRSILLSSFIVVLSAVDATSQTTSPVVPHASGTDAEFRAISAPSADVVWAAGRSAQYTLTDDGGATWRAGTVPGADGLFITGIWSRDARMAHLIATNFDGGLARVYRTDDGGTTWAQQWEASGDGVFMDALQCWSADHCVAYGDPVDGRLMIVRTTDGHSWQRVPADRMPALIAGEAGFAASGTTLTLHGTTHGWIGTGGGASARVYSTRDGGASWSAADTPMQGNSTSGIFGLTFRDSLNGVAVGGNYEQRTERQQNVIRTDDGGRTWTMAGMSRPYGVRYGTAYSRTVFVPAGAGAGSAIRALVATGPSGVGVSRDHGTSWLPLDTTPWNTVAFDPDGNAWLGGPDGRIGVIDRGALLSRSVATSPQQYPTRFSAQLAQQPLVGDAVAWIESNFEQQVDEWIRITELPGMSRHEQQRGEYIRQQLEAEGLIVTVDSMGNVVGRRPGTGGGETVVYAAHMDTVHPLDTDLTVRHDSADVAGRRSRVLRAPGIFDNSASVANMLAIARAMNRAGIRTQGDVIFIATVQEELGLLGMDYWLEENEGVADVLIALDGGLPNVNYGALGIYWTRYSFHGEGSHTNTSAGRPHPARALADAVRDIYTIEIPDYMGGGVYNVGMLAGGKIFNAIPEEVSFTMDLRSVNPILLNDLDAQIDSAVSRAAAAHGVDWSKEQTLRNRAGGTAQMLEDRRTHPLIQTALDVHEHFGIESRAIASGSTDSNAGVVRGIPSISIGRSLGGDQHTLSEWAEVDSALPATWIALLIGLAMAGLAGPGT